METKPWYTSKLVGIGVIQTLIGALELVAEYVNKGDFSSQALIILVTGILTVVLRIWYTNTTIA